MVEGSRTIQSGLPWHGFCLSQFQESVNHYFDDFEQRPSLDSRGISRHYRRSVLFLIAII
jgi:hypothetical protein